MREEDVFNLIQGTTPPTTPPRCMANALSMGVLATSEIAAARESAARGPLQTRSSLPRSHIAERTRSAHLL